MQLVWAENVIRKTNKGVLILTPLAVAQQTVSEAEKFGIVAHRSRDGSPQRNITVTNYEQLHKFDWKDFGGVVADESSIIKHFGGSIQKHLTRFMAKLPYRLLCTATAAPNDYPELGTSSEALGELGYSDMLSRFFAQVDTNKKCRMNDVKASRATPNQSGNYYQKLAYRVAQQIGNWKLKPHAELPFWKWVCSWAVMLQMPSELGYNDGDFVLPKLHMHQHVVKTNKPLDGYLFQQEARTLNERRQARRGSLTERAQLCAEIIAAKPDAAWVVWCDLNDEADLIEKLIPGAVQIAGRHSDDEKESRMLGFINQSIQVLVSKPSICAHGLNLQHCADYGQTRTTRFYRPLPELAVRATWLSSRVVVLSELNSKKVITSKLVST